MRALPDGLAASLAGGVTTLCRCWRITRADGTVLGFTDHDEAIAFEATTFAPAGGFVASADVAGSGLAVGGLDVEGALAADGLDEAELAAGLFDEATVEAYVVDWRDPSDRVRVRVGTIGEVTRQDGGFRAEVRGLAQRLDEARGRLFQRRCDADLGDDRCRKAVGGDAFRATATVTAIEAAALVLDGLGAYAAGWFTHGRLEVLGGTAAGFASEIKRHGKAGSVTVETWRPLPATLAAGDTVRVTAGCDKRYATCRSKFENGINFQGFPHMPGNAFALSYPPHPSGENDGGAIV